MKIKRDYVIFLIIYLIALAITLNFALRNPITSDRGLEYDIYHYTTETGKWANDGNVSIGYLVNSSLTVTYFPAQLQRATGLNEVLLFKTFPCFLYVLMPAFVYLLSRRYLSIRQSILCSMMILTNFYFMYYSNIGRVGVALAFSAVLMWAVLGKRFIIGSIAAILVVLSHYATAFIVLSLLGFALIYMAIRYRQTSKATIVVLGVMLVATYIWYGLIASSVWQIANLFISNTAQLQSGPTVINGIQQANTIKDNFFALSSREELIQVAFGKTLVSMNIPQKIEFVLSWFLVLSVAWGLFVAFWKKALPPLLIGLGIGSFGLLLLTFALPHLSVYYGMERVWFTGLITLAACWVIGTKKLGFYFQGSILILYGLATSGILHRLFGILK
jgi:uncharacterized membrane protein